MDWMLRPAQSIAASAHPRASSFELSGVGADMFDFTMRTGLMNVTRGISLRPVQGAAEGSQLIVHVCFYALGLVARTALAWQAPRMLCRIAAHLSQL